MKKIYDIGKIEIGKFVDRPNMVLVALKISHFLPNIKLS